jgi:carboxylesterase
MDKVKYFPWYEGFPPVQSPLPGTLYEQQVHEAQADGVAELNLPKYFEPQWPAGKEKIGILCVHGYTASPLQGLELAKFFYQQGLAAYLPRLKGHGTTPEDLRRCKWADWTRDVELAYQFLKSRCEKVFIVGFSLGGTLAYAVASGNPDIAGVVTNGAIFKIAHWGAVPLRVIEAVLEHVFRTDMGVFYKPFGMPKVQVPAEERHYTYDIYPLRATYQILELADYVRERLGKIKCPVLAIQSLKDNVVHSSSAQIIIDNISSAQKEKLWYGEKHIELVRPSADILAKIKSFLKI